MKQLLVKSQSQASVVTRSVNVLSNTEDLTLPAWIKQGMSVASGATDPSAGTTAFLLTADVAFAAIRQFSESSASYKTFSIYIRRVLGVGDVTLTVDGVNEEVLALTGAWSRLDVTQYSSSISVGLTIQTLGDQVEVWHPQAEDGDVASVYSANAGGPFYIAQITDVDYPVNTTRGCAYMDGFFFVMSPNGEINQSALDDAFTWSSLDFIKSQNDPSDGVFISKIQSYIVALKEWATELFYNAGNPNGSVLSPVANLNIQLGCASADSVQEMAGSLVWMAQTRNGAGRSVVSMSATSPQKISNPGVEKILDASDLSEVASWSAQVGSHALYGITLFDTNKSIVYDFSTQMWSYLFIMGNPVFVSYMGYTDGRMYFEGPVSEGDLVEVTDASGQIALVVACDVSGGSFLGNDELFSLDKTLVSMVKYTQMPFDVVASVQSNGHQYLQRRGDGGLYELAQNTFTDAGSPIKVVIATGRVDDDTNNNKSLGKLDVIGSKVNSNAYIRWSDDDYNTYSKSRPVNMNSDKPQVRRLGNFRRRSFELAHVDNGPFRVGALEIN